MHHAGVKSKVLCRKGGISLVVLAVGSTAPGLLSFFIDKFSRIFPDYRERVLRHEAAHFLIGYLMGVPIGGYSLDIGKAAVKHSEWFACACLLFFTVPEKGMQCKENHIALRLKRSHFLLGMENLHMF